MEHRYGIFQHFYFAKTLLQKKMNIYFVLVCQSTRCILSNIIAVTKHKNDIDVVQCHETIVIAIDGALCCRFSSISFSLEWCVQLQWSPHWAHVTFTQLRSNLSQMHSRLVIRILNSVANSEYYHSNKIAITIVLWQWLTYILFLFLITHIIFERMHS